MVSVSQISVVFCILAVSASAYGRKKKKDSFLEEVCSLAKDDGKPCTGTDDGSKNVTTKHYFDVKEAHCKKFEYKGCGGNDNKFDESEDCIDSCQTPWMLSNKEEDVEATRKKSDCKLDSEDGPCRALIPQYYWHDKEKKCHKFMYGGCKGNGNRFDDKESCENYCGKGGDSKKSKSDDDGGYGGAL